MERKKTIAKAKNIRAWMKFIFGNILMIFCVILPWTNLSPDLFEFIKLCKENDSDFLLLFVTGINCFVMIILLVVAAITLLVEIGAILITLYKYFITKDKEVLKLFYKYVISIR